MADVEFFFDPVCPWAWITSRWAVEVADQRGLHIDWKFICLRMVNADKDYERDFAPGYVNAHGGGQKMLRVAAAVRATAGNEAVGRYYGAIGTELHDRGRSASELREGNLSAIGDALTGAGLPAELAEAAEDPAHDAVLAAETDLALSRTGKDVGTPILTFHPGTEAEASFFGPVINRVPRGEEAVRVWEAVETLARTPGLSELKRTLRGRPDFT